MTAAIVAFPWSNLHGRARHVAAKLRNKRSDREREIYWRTTVERMGGVMRKIGFTDRQILALVGEFKAAVANATAEGWSFPEEPAVLDFAEAHRLLDDTTTINIELGPVVTGSPRDSRDEGSPGAA